MFKSGLRKLLKRFDPIERILNQVQQLLDSGNLDLAREVIEKARQTYPQQPAINLWYAKIHVALEEFGEAAESLERVENHQEAGFNCSCEAARLLSTIGKEDHAIELFLRLGESTQGPKAARAHSALALIYKRRGQHIDALNSMIDVAVSGKRPYWANVMALLDDCSGSELAGCRDRLRGFLAKDSSNGYLLKLMSLFDSATGRSSAMLENIRGAQAMFFRELHPDVRPSDAAPPLKPAFLIIGAMKSGTTTLFELIKQHPLCLPPMDKELQFFQFPQLDDQWYLEHFPKVTPASGFFTGEASPGYYLFDVVERVKNLLPDVKLIFIHRDPAKRAISHLHHNNLRGIDGADIKILLSRVDELEEELCSTPAQAEQTLLDICYGERPHNLYVVPGCYEILMRRWRRQFSETQLLQLTLENLISNPQQVMNTVFDFVGVECMQIKMKRDNAGQYIDVDKNTQHVVERLNRFYANVARATNNTP